MEAKSDFVKDVQRVFKELDKRREAYGTGGKKSFLVIGVDIDTEENFSVIAGNKKALAIALWSALSKDSNIVEVVDQTMSLIREMGLIREEYELKMKVSGKD